MAVDKTSIVNRAITKLGKSRITNIDSDTTEEAITARLLFDEVRDQLLDEGAWTFATKRVELGLLDSTPEFEYAYEFQLPTDCIRVIGINEDGPGSLDFRIEGRKLLANTNSVIIKYISQITDTSQWTAAFRRAFTLLMTAEMSYSFRADKTLTKMFFEQYEMAVRRGLATDGQQGSNDTIVSPDLIEIR